MSTLTTVSNNTMTSLEIVEQVNIFRQEEDVSKYKPLLHKNLLTIIRDEFSEEINELNILPVRYKDAKGESRPMFKLSMNEARQILMRESKYVRKAMIAYITRLENKLSQLPDFTNPVIAARAWANEVEAKEQLVLQIEEVKEEASEALDFKEAITNSKKMSTVGDVASLLDMGRTTLYKFLRTEGLIMMYENRPKAQFIQSGHLSFKVTDINGRGCTSVLISGKGIDLIKKRLTLKAKGEAQISMPFNIA